MKYEVLGIVREEIVARIKTDDRDLLKFLAKRSINVVAHMHAVLYFFPDEIWDFWTTINKREEDLSSTEDVSDFCDSVYEKSNEIGAEIVTIIYLEEI